jgi:hypothetical protein
MTPENALPCYNKIYSPPAAKHPISHDSLQFENNMSY